MPSRRCGAPGHRLRRRGGGGAGYPRTTFLDAGGTSWAPRSCASGCRRLRVGRGRWSSSPATSGKRNTPIIRDPTRLSDADYVLVESTYGGASTSPRRRRGASWPSGPPRRRARRRPPRALVRDRADPGADLGPRPARGGRRGPGAAALPGLPDGPRGDLHLSRARRVLRRGDPAAAAGARVAARLPVAARHAQGPGVGAHRPYPAAVHHRGLERHAHRRALRGPCRGCSRPGRRSCSSATRGRGRWAGTSRTGHDGAPRRRRPRGSLPGSLGQRLLGPRRRARDRRWLAGFAAGKSPGAAGFPRRVFLVHGDPGPQAALAPKVAALGFEVHIPRWHETVTLGSPIRPARWPCGA